MSPRENLLNTIMEVEIVFVIVFGGLLYFFNFVIS